MVRFSDQNVLVPPGVKKPEAAEGSFTFRTRVNTATCGAADFAFGITKAKGRLQVTVTALALGKQPPGWLFELAAALERESCVPPGEGPTLAERIRRTLPVDFEIETERARGRRHEQLFRYSVRFPFKSDRPRHDGRRLGHAGACGAGR